MLCELNYVNGDTKYFESADDASVIIEAYTGGHPVVFLFNNNESNGEKPEDLEIYAPVYITLEVYLPERTIIEDEEEETLGPGFGIHTESGLYTEQYINAIHGYFCKNFYKLQDAHIAQNGKLRIYINTESTK